MKKTILSFLLIATIFGFAGPVDKETALKVANTFRNNDKAYQSSIKAGRTATTLADITESTTFHNFYIFSDEQSFVIVSADDCVQPILAYSMGNPFKADAMPTNIASWLQGYEEQIHMAKSHHASPSQEVRQTWELLKGGKPLPTERAVVVEPLIQTRWDQTSPYNNLCPTGTYTGCVATAMAQIMKYWNYPEHGIGEHSYVHSTYGTLSADFGATTYQWSDMTNTYSSSSSAASKEAVATLMYHCGVSVDMNYGTGGSGASTSNVANALKNYFNYNTSLYFALRSTVNNDTQWKALLKNDLDNSRPIQYSGQSTTSGHSFICDGYDSDGSFHFNWGWSGYCDGYFTIDNLAPGTGGSGAGQGVYNNQQGAIFSIEPPSSSIEAPLNLVADYDNGITELTWTASNGAASYNIYRNGLLLASGITATNYTDNSVPYGTIKYYVRAVDSNGLLSLASNYATIERNYETPIVDDLAGTLSGRDITLTWSAPDWCYPEEESATLTYGNGNVNGTMGYGNQNIKLYWGHRYTSSDLGDYENMSIFKVSFYANDVGSYKLYIYEDTNISTYTNSDTPKTMVYEQDIVTGETGWNEVILNSPFIIDASKDIWVFIYDPEAREYPSTFCSYSGNEGNYYSYYSTNYPYSPQHFVLHYSNKAFLIKTYLTDGIYTYNIYRNSEKIASEQDGFTYTDYNLADGHYEYYLTTNYYKGESDASNIVEFNIPETVLEYTVTTAVNPEEGGNVSGGGTYTAETTCTLTATPSENYYFTHFENSSVSTPITDNPYTFTVTSNCTVTAHFATVEVGNINTPQSICSNETLTLTPPQVTGDTQSTGWQIAANNDFSSPTTYTNQTLDDSYDGWWLRYCVFNENLGYIYSNSVQISVGAVYETEWRFTACDSYEWNDIEYTSSGDKVQTLSSISGCDSIVTLHLTINHADNVTLEPVTACDSYVWNGQTYTTSQVINHDTIDANGCQYTETLSLTINHADNVTLEPVTACDSYVWNGQTYTSSQVINHDTIDANGCTYTETLSLTINHADNVTLEPVTTCDSYMWNGQTYTSSQVISHDTIDANGCQYTETLSLTINHADNVTLEPVTTCDSYVWNGQTYTTSQVINHDTIDANGCQYTETLSLTINHADNVTLEPVTTCDSYVWNGQTYTSSQVINHDTIDANGCQYTETLSLTINHANDVTLEPVTACDSYVWNGQTYTTSQVINHDTIDANGCQYTETLALTINHADNVTLEPVTTCDSYVWNGQTYTTSQVISHDTIDANGCPYAETLSITINHAEEVTIEGNTEIVDGEETTLTASEGASYEWSNGETTQSITVAPVVTTTYTVTVTDANGCLATAEIVVSVDDGIGEDTPVVNIYPNPTKQVVNIEAENITNIRVVDMLGQTLYETNKCGDKVQIDLSGYSVGNYFLQVTANDRILTRKVVKH